jgi:hypothetical protein
MRAFLKLTVAAALAATGLTAGSSVVPGLDSPALAQKAKGSKGVKKPRTERRPAAQTTGFGHQQCSVQNPCSTRNTW